MCLCEGEVEGEGEEGVLRPQCGFLPEFISLERGKEREAARRGEERRVGLSRIHTHKKKLSRLRGRCGPPAAELHFSVTEVPQISSEREGNRIHLSRTERVQPERQQNKTTYFAQQRQTN